MPRGLDLHGIDISPKMLARLREKNLPIRSAVGDFRAIPFPDGVSTGLSPPSPSTI